MVLLLFQAVSNCFGQNYSFKHLKVEDGLLSELWMTFAEDRLGRLWMASEEGINVFDGSSLSSYSLPDKSGLLSNNVNQIFCDRNGNMWISTYSGVQYKKESETHFQYRKELEPLKNTLFFGHAPDSGILAITKDAAYYVSPSFAIKQLRWLDNMYATNSMLLGFHHLGGSRYSWSFKNNIIVADICKHRLLKTIPYNQAWAICSLTDSTFISGSYAMDSMFIVNIGTGEKEYINNWNTSDGAAIGGYVPVILPAGNDKYIFSSRYYGVYILDVKNKYANHIVREPHNELSLKVNFCRKIIITKSRVLFVHARGLSYTPLDLPSFTKVNFLVDKHGTKYSDGFNDFAEDSKGKLWIATTAHLAYLDRKSGLSTFYPFHQQEGDTTKYKTVRSVAIDKKDRVWVGTFGGGLGRLLPNGKYKRVKDNPNHAGKQAPGNQIYALNTDTKGNFFVCATNGFTYFDPLTESVNSFHDHPLKKIQQITTYYAIETKDGKWWIGQSDGLKRYDPSTMELLEIRLLPEMGKQAIYALEEDKYGNIYAGSNQGVFIIDPTLLKIKRTISKKEGLASDFITGIIADQQQNIWILGNRGLSRYDPSTSSLELFTAKDGIDPSNHTYCNYYLSNNGEMFIGSSGAFNHFFPETIKVSDYNIPVFITQLELADTFISNSGNQKINLRHFQNNISFSYLAVDYNLAPYIIYRYQLKGYDTSYIVAGNQRKARYTNLPAGNYTFNVSASINGKDWFDAKTPVAFEIRSALWNQNWFLLLCGSSFAGITYLTYKRRVRIIKHREQERTEYELRINEMENNLLRTQMNPHFIFNSLNTINAFINSNNKGEANQYISKFSRLIRMVLEHSRQKRVSLGDELEALRIYIQIEQIRFSNQFEYSISLSDELQPSVIEIPSLMIQPFVENAILHGLLPLQNGGKLTIFLMKEGEMLRCEIIDNGIGRHRAMTERSSVPRNQKSHGLAITLKRIELFNKEQGFKGGTEIVDLHDAQGKPFGTKVIIRLAYASRF